MNAQEIINSGLLESFVLGIASPEEVLMVQTAISKEPELLKEIEKIENTLLGMAAKGPAPGAHVRSNLLAQIQASASHDRPITKVGNERGSYSLALAASVALFVLSVALNLYLLNRMNSLKARVNEMEQEKNVLADSASRQRIQLANLKLQMNVVSDPFVKLIVLNGMNDCKESKTSVYWNHLTGEVHFNATSLVSNLSHDYQLWAIVNGKPVDAGVIHLSPGSAFVKMKPINKASAFAITLEQKGGSEVPTLSAMCYLGQVGT